MKKTIIVPLWTFDLVEARRIVTSIVPEWKAVRIALNAKYLGMELGPQTLDIVWKNPLDKYIARVEIARGTGAGFLCAVLEYNTDWLPSVYFHEASFVVFARFWDDA